MKRIGLTGLVLVAALALSPGSALALSHCVKLAPGEKGFYTELCSGEEAGEQYAYVESVSPFLVTTKGNDSIWCAKLSNSAKNSLWLDSRCSKDSATDEGEYAEYLVLQGGTAKAEFKVLPTAKAFKGVSGSVTLEAGPEATFSCSAGTDAGEITSMDTVGKVVVKLTGCKVTGESKTCTAKSVGAGEGEIVLRTLKGELGTVKSSEAPSEVGLLLEPATSKTVVVLAESACAVETSLGGELAGAIEPVRTAGPMSSITYTSEVSGSQAIKKISLPSGVREPKLVAFGVPAIAMAVDNLEFGGNTEIT